MATAVTTSPAVRERIAGPDELVIRNLRVVYARERIEEVVRAVAEDALDPNRGDVSMWADDARFDDDLGIVIVDVSDTVCALLAERLAELLQTAPPRLAGRLSATPRFSDQT